MFLSLLVRKKIGNFKNLKPWFGNFKSVFNFMVFRILMPKCSYFLTLNRIGLFYLYPLKVSFNFFNYCLILKNIRSKFLIKKFKKSKILLKKILISRFKFYLDAFFKNRSIYRWKYKNLLMFRKKKYFLPLFLKHNGKKYKTQKYLFFSLNSFSLLKKKKRTLNSIHLIKRSLHFLLKKFMFKFGSLSNLKQFMSSNPALYLKSFGLVKMLLLIFNLSLNVKKNWYNFFYLQLINKICKNCKIFNEMLGNFMKYFNVYKRIKKKYKNDFKRFLRINYMDIKCRLKWVIKEDYYLFIQNNFEELFSLVKFVWVDSATKIKKRSLKCFLWRLWQSYTMQFSLDKKNSFKSLYQKIVKKYKFLWKMKFNIYIEDKFLTFMKFPNFVKNVELKSNKIKFISPIKLPKNYVKGDWKSKFKNNEYFKSVIFWKFFFKPFYFWLIYFFNIFFFKYLKILFNL